LTLKNRLQIAPIEDKLQAQGGWKVVDFGTRTGIWALDFGMTTFFMCSTTNEPQPTADKHPSATVIGIDLSPIQPN